MSRDLNEELQTMQLDFAAILNIVRARIVAVKQYLKEKTNYRIVSTRVTELNNFQGMAIDQDNVVLLVEIDHIDDYDISYHSFEHNKVTPGISALLAGDFTVEKYCATIIAEFEADQAKKAARKAKRAQGETKKKEKLERAEFARLQAKFGVNS